MRTEVFSEYGFSIPYTSTDTGNIKWSKMKIKKLSVTKMHDGNTGLQENNCNRIVYNININQLFDIIQKIDLMIKHHFMNNFK